ncbi:hypothetical protein QQX98_005930 [Neonectria punicea]|uniref:CCHC-type domain-containing protein n=1 Tax=Neonectria punicea TaxID=979145 RepID=A0ABR1H2S6_9HYPO
MAEWATAARPGDIWTSASASASVGQSSKNNFVDNTPAYGSEADFRAIGKENLQPGGFGQDTSNGFSQDNGTSFEHGNDAGFDQGNGADDDKCFGCGEAGAECPTAEEMTCRFCKQPGHMVRDCPDKPPMACENCGEEGHMRKNCENARKINREHIASVTPDEAWQKLEEAVSERDVDDAKEAVQEYIKALDGKITYRELQEALIEQSIGLWLIATEKPLISIFTNMNLQGEMGKKYTISYRFSEKADRPRELEGWPKDRAEILSRLDDAGDVVDKGVPLCLNCKELGHISKFCTQEKVERTDGPKISCHNCGGDGHRVRDCPEPRIDKFACKNCGQSGHKVAECEEPPNPENVECRKCNEMGHFAKDCPQGGGRACRNCGQEGHMSKECDQPRNMDTVTCRNCEKTGHFSKECPEPRDWSKVQCSNCQEFGHTKVRCKVPPVESQDFNGDGFPPANNNSFDNTANAGGDAGWSGGSGGDTAQYATDGGGW